MDIKLCYTELIKLAGKLVGHKLQQYRLGTNEKVLIETKYGKVCGLVRKTLYDEELYYAFEGIPYAKPPLGELRFRAPEPVEAWSDVRDCTYCRAKPIQKDMILGRVEGSEDCLYLNVYAKKLKSPKPLPVLVWIYGGAFQTGEATRDLYSPDYFMKQDVILVTVNYRLGALGFLSLKSRELNVPGNAGLKDQVLALRWINQNIANFNGDSSNITLFGESAGAAATHIMTLTEQTRGLFHKFILQSGTALSAWSETPDHNWAFRLATRTGYKGADSDDEQSIFHHLMRVTPQALSTNDLALLTQTEQQVEFLLFAFGPVVEPYVTQQCVIPKKCKAMLPNAWGNELPMIIGGNSFEGLFSYQIIDRDPSFLQNFESCLPRDVRLACDAQEMKPMVERLKQTYFNDANRQSMSKFEALDIYSHRQIWHDLHRTVLARHAYATPRAPTYLYRFDYDSAHFNHFRILVCGKQVRGVSHADELSYLFYQIPAYKLRKSSPEYKTIERMVGMWTAFAATSNPNCAQTAEAVWLPVDAAVVGAKHKCFNISEQLKFIELPEAARLECWDTFYTKVSLY